MWKDQMIAVVLASCGMIDFVMHQSLYSAFFIQQLIVAGNWGLVDDADILTVFETDILEEFRFPETAIAQSGIAGYHLQVGFLYCQHTRFYDFETVISFQLTASDTDGISARHRCLSGIDSDGGLLFPFRLAAAYGGIVMISIYIHRVRGCYLRNERYLISKIKPRECPLIKFRRHSFFFFIDKIH